jgi:hydroxyacylglutathione hydrolase
MEPWFLLTGDLLFVASVGRPDLPGDAEKNARKLYQTLQEKILLLPDYLEIYPAHFSGSACGKGMSGKPVSTLGFGRRFNRFLSMKEEEFVTAITSDIPAKPPEMMRIIRKNQGYN